MNSNNFRIEHFLHVPHMWILADLLDSGLLSFGLLLLLLDGRRRRHGRANLDFQGNWLAEMLFQRCLDTIFNRFV